MEIFSTGNEEGDTHRHELARRIMTFKLKDGTRFSSVIATAGDLYATVNVEDGEDPKEAERRMEEEIVSTGRSFGSIVSVRIDAPPIGISGRPIQMDTKEWRDLTDEKEEFYIAFCAETNETIALFPRETLAHHYGMTTAFIKSLTSNPEKALSLYFENTLHEIQRNGTSVDPLKMSLWAAEKSFVETLLKLKNFTPEEVSDEERTIAFYGAMSDLKMIVKAILWSGLADINQTSSSMRDDSGHVSATSLDYSKVGERADLIMKKCLEDEEVREIVNDYL